MRKFVPVIVAVMVFIFGLVSPAIASEVVDDGEMTVINEAKADLTPALTTPESGLLADVPPPVEVYGFVQWVGTDLLDDPVARFKRAKIYLDAPFRNGYEFRAALQRASNQWAWTELTLGRYTEDWDFSVGIGLPAVTYSTPAPNTLVLVTYPPCTDIPTVSAGIFGRLKVGDATVYANALNGDDSFSELQLDAVSFRVEVPFSDGRSTFAVSSYHGDDFGRDRELLAADFHTGWDGGFADAFYAWDEGSQPFSGGYWLVAFGDETKFVAEADYYDQPGVDGEWSYALGINHNFATPTHKGTQLRIEARDAGDDEWTLSTLLQIAIN